MYKNFSKAFTLAEVIITIGIIGIVAAMTIPSLVTKYREKATVTKVKEMVSIISQAILMVEPEYGTPETWGLSTNGRSQADAEKIGEIMKHGLKISSDCGTVDANGECFTKDSYKYLNGTNRGAFGNEYYKVVLINGSSIAMRLYTENQVDFFFDVNGKLPPNVVGKDLFAVNYMSNIGVLADGAPNSGSRYETQCKLTDWGWGCAYYILKFGNMDYLHSK